MNIFVVSADPTQCAEILDDRRLIKMAVEQAQMLGTALHHYGAKQFLPKNKQGKPYGVSHPNHPCTRWVCKRRENYAWTVEYLHALSNEYQYRWKKESSWGDKIALFRSAGKYIWGLGWNAVVPNQADEFCNCSRHKDLYVFQGYRVTLMEKWEEDCSKGRPPKWTRREVQPLAS